MESEHVGNYDVQHGEERIDSSDYHDYTNKFIPEALFARGWSSSGKGEHGL
ncbi:hypothetical protein Syun_017826 [Stephania yunnanensis]|uniref:Uncharacterized protein n=1 Tax=Stephania yunnanensis TaxID=152371 RepID=A0AAP0J7L8_9MAGN